MRELAGYLLAVVLCADAVASEVWSATFPNGIYRYTAEGQPLAPITTGNTTNELCVVGNEVWSAEPNWIYRYSLTGQYLGARHGVTNTGRLAAVGTEVWSPGTNYILRMDHHGTSLGTITGPCTGFVTVVGNEVWSGGDNGFLYRYDFAGNPLPTLTNRPASQRFTVVGNEVWSMDGNHIYRYDFTGTPLSTIISGITNPRGTLTWIGDEVWFADPSGGGYLFRLGLNGEYLGFYSGRRNGGYLTVVPCPPAVSLMPLAWAWQRRQSRVASMGRVALPHRANDRGGWHCPPFPSSDRSCH